jgi:tetratricopeptide (TPR) repeat protein
MAWCTPYIGSVISIFLAFKDKFFPRPFDGIIKPICDIDPDDFDVKKPPFIKLSDIDYINTFISRPEGKEIRDAIENHQSVLIMGKVAQGKSREAFQVLYEMRNRLVDYSLVRPNVKRDIKKPSKESEVIIFLDDLNKYAEEKFELANFLRHFKENVIVIATCRSGDEYHKACEQYIKEIELFKKIQLKDIDYKEAVNFAEKTNCNIKNFDGTPGSIILGVDRIKETINRLSVEQKAILRAMKLLASVDNYFPRIKVVEEVSVGIFKVTILNFNNEFCRLAETGLITKNKTICRIWHDKYLDMIDFSISNGDKEYLERLQKILFKLKDYQGLTSLSVWYGKVGYFDDAITACNYAIKLNNRYIFAYSNRATAYSAKKIFAKAIVDYTKAIEINPKIAELYSNRGTAFHLNCDLDRALDDYNEAIRLNPGFSVAYNNRGNVYSDMGKIDLAINDFSKAWELNPKDTSALRNRALDYLKKNELDKAFDDYTTVIKHNPKDAVAYNNRANIFMDKGKIDRAIEDYTNAIEINPKFVEALYNRGHAYVKKDDFHNGIKDYTKVIEINPSYKKAYYKRGYAYVKIFELDKAIYDFTKALELSPHDIDVLNDRGVLYYNLREFDKAIADYNKVIEYNSAHTSAFYNRGLAYSDKGELNKAIADYTKVLEFNPNDAEIFFLRGIVYAKNGEFDKAIEDYIKANQINPKNILIMANLGRVFHVKGDKNKTKYWYEEVLKHKDQLPDKGEQIIKWLKELE